MTGKGDRWEGDGQGRSEPAFQVPAPSHSLHQPALHDKRPANICGCCFFEACAGRIVRRLCLPAAALFCGLCLPAAFAMPTAHINVLAPVHFALLRPLFISMRARIVASCTDCPVGSYNTGLQWRPVRRF